MIGVVYENRPNVTSDVAGLCVRSGNAAFLRGSSSAQATNTFVVGLWHEALEKEGLPREGVSLVEDPSHETVAAFMQLSEVLDCLIPRGGPSLIAAMRENARVPYVLDGDGNCHIYVDESADARAVARHREEREDLAPGRLQRGRDGARARSHRASVLGRTGRVYARGGAASRRARPAPTCPARRSPVTRTSSESSWT